MKRDRGAGRAPQATTEMLDHDAQVLASFSLDELLGELIAREAAPKTMAEAIRSERGEAFREIGTAAIIEAVKGQQKVIYGTDDRVDIFQITDQAILSDADSVVALFQDADVVDNGDGTSTLGTANFGTSRNLCAGEPFRAQPIGAFCSGFLVAPDVVATAGHCVNAANVTTTRFVFGFRMIDASTAQTIIDNAEIYRGLSVIDRRETGAADWALIRIDRSVTNHRVATIRRQARIPDGQAVHVIGHPVGLPAKYAPGASVRDNTPAAFFVANLDTYGGNSGSPVFNAQNHMVEGVLVRGEADFRSNGTCTVSLICPDTGCRGEDCTRTTEFAALLVPPSLQQFILQTGTALHETDGTFAFAVADWDGNGRPDLIALKKRNTGTSSTEVHILSGASNFQQFILQTGTALHETDETFAFAAADWDGDGRPDLIALKKSNTGTSSTEVHILA